MSRTTDDRELSHEEMIRELLALRANNENVRREIERARRNLFEGQDDANKENRPPVPVVNPNGAQQINLAGQQINPSER